jgi:hypothetical protein
VNATSDPPLLDVRALLDARALGHPVHGPRLVETHISWVLLTGEYAYKIHKPVRLPFLDFTTLAARKADCQRELELNRRWAPSLYLNVLPVFGPASSPSLIGDGEPVDYAVRMRQFPDDARLDRVAARGDLDEPLVESLAGVVARLHAQAPRSTHPHYGSPAAIAREVAGNLEALEAFAGCADRAALAAVCTASRDDLGQHAPQFEARRRGGFVRECHGDLHLENIALVDGEVLPFDGVEFEPAFRWVDVASDLAFLLMDLSVRGHAPLANRLLDCYLQHSGDYAALTVLRHYLRYRALVRAKVAAIRSTQPGAHARAARAQANRLIAYAASLSAAPQPVLIITHGVSGTGKSWLAARLAMRLGAVCLRSDVERARLYPDGPARYAPPATRATYDRLAELAGSVLAAGYTAIVDATFQDVDERRRMARVACAAQAGWRVLDLSAPRAVLQRRVRERARRGDDASQADTDVLHNQLASAQPLSAAERASALSIDTAAALDLDLIAHWITTPLQGTDA